MGQARQRGNFEQRKAEAVERDKLNRRIRAELMQRRPSPKHVKLMAAIAAVLGAKHG